jgi:hypothetical protein
MRKDRWFYLELAIDAQLLQKMRKNEFHSVQGYIFLS